MLVYRCFCLTADNRVIGRAHIDAADVGIAVEMAARATASLHRSLGGQRVAASGGSYSTQTQARKQLRPWHTPAGAPPNG
jgi:hypothetical protein